MSEDEMREIAASYAHKWWEKQLNDETPNLVFSIFDAINEALKKNALGLEFNLVRAQNLLNVFGGEEADVTVAWREAGTVKDDESDDRSLAGLYAHYTEYPEEGVICLESHKQP